MFFSFPEDARWNSDKQAVEFSVGLGEYQGMVRVPRKLFRRFLQPCSVKCIIDRGGRRRSLFWYRSA